MFHYTNWLHINGVTGSPFYWSTVTEQRREGIRKLRVGMSKEEVEQILPNPYLVEVPEEGLEYWLYVTSRPSGGISSNNTTPVAFRQGKVIGWGRNFFINKEQKYEIEIK